MKKIIASFLVVLTLSFAIYPALAGITPVTLSYKYGPKLDGTPKPSKAPIITYVTISVFFDEDQKQLLLFDSAQSTYTYCIYNNLGIALKEGALNFQEIESLMIEIEDLNCGTYRIEITNQKGSYYGSFNIN